MMEKEKLTFCIGMVAGIVIAGFFFHFYAPRYDVQKSGTVLIKQDKWTGDSWRYMGNQWKKITPHILDWNAIDKILREELHLPDSGTKTMEYLNAIQQAHPILTDISTEDLLERMGQVYLREVMTNNYLTSYGTLLKVKELEKKKNDADNDGS